jgi:hypothetical protein
MAQLDRIKITAICWDSDREPGKFNSWLETFSSLVRSTADRPALEEFLDYKLNRQVSQPVAVPSFITEDDDFALGEAYVPPHRAAAQGGSTGAGSTPGAPPESPLSCYEELLPPSPDRSGRSSHSQRSAFTLAPAPLKYRDMPEASRSLDALLYNILKMNVKGSKNALLSCVQYPSYVQAVSVLVKHMDISRNDRKTRAFDSADKLTFTGDVHAYQIAAIGVVKELFDAKCTIMDFALTKIMKSFDGRNKPIQYGDSHYVPMGTVCPRKKLL